MLYPHIIIIAGVDLKIVKNILNDTNINYTIDKTQKTQEKTQLLFRPCINLKYDSNVFNINNICEGLNFSLFNNENIKLNWNVKKWVPENWTLDSWEINMDNDVNVWFSKDSNFTLTDTDILMMSTIINISINNDYEMLKIYRDALLTVFLHPDVQTMFNWCMTRKVSHIQMWLKAKEKLLLPNRVIEFPIQLRAPANTLERVVDDLVEIITKEEIKEPSATKLLTYFTNKNHLIEFSKAVNRRDQESITHSKVIMTLLDEINRQYPFLNNYISETTDINVIVENQKNQQIYKFENSFKFGNM